MTDKKTEARAADHLANERTFLAWIRTSIGIMAMGFVVERFALFTKQITFFLAKSGANQDIAPTSHHNYALIFGTLLVAFGIVAGIVAFFNYKKVEKQINSNVFKSSVFLGFIFTMCVVIIGVFLILYLVNS